MKLPSNHRRLFTKSEWKLLGTTAETAKLAKLTPTQKRTALKRLRKLNTKYRDLSRRQAMKAQKTKGYRNEQASARTKKKAQLVGRVCTSAF